jgi:hypothetical protein
MSYTTTTRLQLQKAVIGSNQPFETSVINNNWDKLDSESIAQDGRLDILEASTITQDARLTTVEGRATTIEGVNTTQGSAITTLQTKTNSGTVYDSARVGGRTVFAQSGTPTALAVGDIWIQIP